MSQNQNSATILIMEWNLYGHQWAADILQKHISNDSIRHAYLFSGAPGIGRRSLAIKFAQAINCTQPPTAGTPCGICRVCKQTASLQQPDLSIVQVEEDKHEIRIEQIREVQRSLSLSPYEAKYRIALLLNFHLANPNAQNALLKTLEEAPAKVILLLTADAAENLLPTITSRCEILRLRPVAITEMIPILQTKWNLDPQSAKEIAHLSSGRYGLAQAYISNPEQLELIHDRLMDQVELFKMNLPDRFQYIEKLTVTRRRDEVKETIQQIIQIWLLFWRDALLQKSGDYARITYTQFSSISQQISTYLSLEQINAFIKKLEETLTLLENNINIRLLLEELIIEWPALQLKY
ncbi:MAG: DNA polymerase III subunit [Anaerolineaceae bacterium]